MTMSYASFFKAINAFAFLLLPLLVYSQGPDCDQALVICSDGAVQFNPQGPGIDDFADPDNNSGCLSDVPIAENQSAWYYFEFQPDMPPNSVITFTISPDAGGSQDYDFAVFGPDVECDALGNPIRCSYSGQGGDTGLSTGANDTSENASGDRFVAALTVQPGQGFFLLVDNFSDNSSGFSMTWGESAAPFLNCNATPGCAIEISTNGPFQICSGGGDLNLSAIVTGTIGIANYSWVDGNGSTALFSDPTSLNPTVTLPNGFTGDLSFILTVTDEDCTETAIINLSTYPPIEFDPQEYDFCFGDNITINIPGNYVSYQWSTGDIGPSILMDATNHNLQVTVTDANGCTGVADFDVTEHPQLLPDIFGDNTICVGQSASFAVGEEFFAYDWSTGEISQGITVFDPGIYSVTVYNEADCFEVIDWEVTEISFPELEVDGPLGLCQGDTVLITTEQGYPEYFWNNLAQGASISIDAPGVYEVTVVDEDGCLHYGDIDIGALDDPIPTILGDSIFCTNDSTSLSLSETYPSYLWSNSATTPAITVSNAGNYSVTVVSEEGCSGETNINIQEQTISVEITGQNNFCSGESATISVPNTFASYLWSNGTSANSISVTQEGTYAVTVTDNFGCSSTDSITIIENPLPNFDIEGNLAICPNGQTTLMPDSSFTSYLWTNSNTSPSIIVTSPGNYGLTVTDSNGCSSSDNVTVVEEDMLDISLNGVLAICDNDTTEIGVNGDYASYEWTNGAASSSVFVGSAGVVGVTVQDAFGCVGVDSVNVEVFELPDFEITGNNQYCQGTTTVLNTTPAFNAYEWSDGSSAPLDTISSPGAVFVTVTDANGCKNSNHLTVTENPNPTPQIGGIPQYCPNTSTELNVLNNYSSYAWSTGGTEQQTTVSEVGNVFVTVVDENGCIGMDTVNVSLYQLTEPIIEGDLKFCPEGETTLNVNQNFETYQWSSTDTTNQITIDNIGNIAVTVTDEHGCQTSSSEMLDYYTVAKPLITGNDFCEGETTTILGELGFNTYLWSNGSDSDTIDVSSGGTYFLTVTDANGCKTDNSVDIIEHPLPQFEIDGLAQFCIGFSTKISVENNFAAVQWASGETSDTIEVNTAGLYTVSVTDEFGCVGTNDILVEELQSLSPVVFGDLHYCENDTTTLEGTSGFLTYQWSNGSTEQSITVNTPGNYELTVTDESGCTGDTLVTVIEDALPTPDITGVFDFCPDEMATLSADTTYVAYSWSSGDTLNAISTNTPGLYHLTVTDINGCSNETQELVVENPSPSFDITGIDYFCQGSSTEVSVSAAFENYNWSDGSHGQSTIVSNEGNISVEVENEFGCKGEDTINIDEIEFPVINAGPDKVLDCEVRSVALEPTDMTIPDNWIYIWQGDGLAPAEVNVPNPTIEQEGIYSLYLWDETHQCETEETTVEVVDNAYTPDVFIQVLDTLNCLLESVRISTFGSEEGEGIRYNWYKENQLIPNENHPFIFVSEPGIYSFEVIDDSTHCIAIDDAEVIEDESFPIADAGIAQHLDCNITQVNLQGTNSQAGPTISYEWHPLGAGNIIAGFTTNEPIVNSPGLYELIVSDTINGCSNKDTVEVTQDILKPIVDAGQDQTLDCQTEEVMLEGSVSMVNENFVLSWTRLGNPTGIGQGSNLLTSEAGIYQLEATNLENGCKNTDQVEVIFNDNNPKQFVVDQQDNSCYQSDDAYIVISETIGGTPPLLYSFDGGDFSSLNLFNNLAAGTYSLVVQDANGCELDTIINIREGNDLAVELGDDIFIDFGESVDIEAQISLPVDSLASLVWQLQDSIECTDPYCLSFVDTPLLTTNYQVTITDENGCTRVDDLTVFVNKPRDVFIPNGFSPNGDGINDELIVFAGRSVAYVKSFLIFNRWGEIVFEVYDFPPNDPTFGWDGHYRGTRYNNAVFTYFAEVVFIDGEEILFKGDVTLVK